MEPGWRCAATADAIWPADFSLGSRRRVEHRAVVCRARDRRGDRPTAGAAPGWRWRAVFAACHRPSLFLHSAWLHAGQRRAVVAAGCTWRDARAYRREYAMGIQHDAVAD